MNQRSFRAEWEAELNRLELDVVRVERMLAGDSTSVPVTRPWMPPVVREPLPHDLVPRARALLDRQDRAGTALRRALASAGKQLAYGSRVGDATTSGPAQPVYLDLEA